MKKIFKSIGLCLCSIVLAVGCFFSSKFSYNNAVNIASADSVDVSYTFKSSDLYHFDSFYFRDNISSVHSCMFGTDVTFDSELNLLVFSPHFFVCSVDSDHYLNYSIRDRYHYQTSTGYITGVGGFEVPLNSATYVLINSAQSSLLDYYELAIFASSGFNCNVSKVTLSLVNTSVKGVTSDIAKFLRLQYFTPTNDYLIIDITVPREFLFNERSYYLVPDLTNNDIFNEGYNQGLADNQQNIYNNGYSAGQTAGYNSGFNEGVLSSNDYSFIGLIGAVIDVPFQTFKGALNYDILGINMFTFYTSLLTLGLVIFVVKLVLGGK